MLARFLPVLLLLAAAPTAPAQAPTSPEPAGHWAGAFVRAGSVQPTTAEFTRSGDSLRVALSLTDRPSLPRRARVERDAAGRWVFPTPFGPARLALDTVYGEMTGPAGADSLGIRLHLKRTLHPPEPPVAHEDVVFRSGGATLAGTLVRPAGIARPAVAVLVQGRGCSTRAGLLGYAELLARYGTAALAVDRRGTGTSTGACETATVGDLAGDVAAAVRYLAGRGDVDPARVGVVGWSAGGWVGTLASRSTPVAFLAMHVGPATSVREQQLGSMRLAVRSLGLHGADSAAAIRYIDLMFAEGDRRARYEEMVRIAGEWERSGLASEFLAPGDFPRRETEADSLWVRLHDYDPAPELRRFRAPLLAIYGAEDPVVPPDDNVPLLRRLMREAGNPDARIVVVPRAGHGLSQGGEMRTLGEGGDAVTYWKFPRPAPEALEALLSFLRDHGMTGAPPPRR